MPTTCEFVTLRSGLTVPLEPVRLLLNLESRGLTVTHDGSDLIIRPRGQLTDADREALRRWKPHVIALIDYQVPGTVQ
jgi:hypothetical protein